MQRHQQLKYNTLAVCFLLYLIAYFVLLLYYHSQLEPRITQLIYRLYFLFYFLFNVNKNLTLTF